LGKSKGRRTLDKVEGFKTSVAEETWFIGTMGGDGHCIIHGRVEGDCELNGTLVIGEKGSWKGDIKAENVLIAGQVDGNVEAKDKIEIVSTARIKGAVSSAVMAIAEGAIHEGEIKITSKSDLTEFNDKRDSTD
jgi:cytoskeletal protein CcmA (bactofilin family)